MTENDVVLKYQILPEDLDALVSVKSDEELKHMMDEYNRHEKLRTFLFPANPLVLESQLGPIESSPQTIEQRYIEAVNGILRKSPSLRAAPVKTRPTFTLSACSSPRSESSPDGYGLEMPETGSYQLSRLYPMHKVQSSPIITQPHSYHHHSFYLQPPNYLTCRLRPPPSPPLVSQRGWDPPHNSGGGNGKCGCNEERRFLGRTGSVPQSAMNHVLRLWCCCTGLHDICGHRLFIFCLYVCLYSFDICWYLNVFVCVRENVYCFVKGLQDVIFGLLVHVL